MLKRDLSLLVGRLRVAQRHSQLKLISQLVARFALLVQVPPQPIMAHRLTSGSISN